MRIFDGTNWRSGYLDEHRSTGELRVRPTRWATLGPVEGLSIDPGTSVRRVLDYAQQLGPIRLARKVASRWGERSSQSVVFACGFGEVLEADQPELVGRFVVWIAPVVPPGAERIVLDERLARPLDEKRSGAFTFVEAATSGLAREISGWSRFSGASLPELEPLLDECEKVLSTGVVRQVFDWETTPVAEFELNTNGPSARSVTVFGWGHHARTQLVPSLPPDWKIGRVHEIDPRRHGNHATSWDTAPGFREDEDADVVCIAGFHSTHGPLAAETLRRGGVAVVEKPVITTIEQLERLLDAWEQPSRLFALYHRRYGVIAEALERDLVGAIDMHATVYEIPLPERHWYRWPSSGGRIVCNGCHWIDQFLWLNPGAEVNEAHAQTGPRGQVFASLGLTNGAFMSLTLTDRGSARRGTREFTEFRTNSRTARVVDGVEYVCEDHEREVSRLQSHPLDALESAYRSVFRAIEAGEPGDSRESVERTHRAMLQLAQLASKE